MQAQNQVVFTTEDINTLISSLEDSLEVSQQRLNELTIAIEVEVPTLQEDIQRKANLLSILKAKV
jgi:hypothetical protein